MGVCRLECGGAVRVVWNVGGGGVGGGVGGGGREEREECRGREILVEGDGKKGRQKERERESVEGEAG